MDTTEAVHVHIVINSLRKYDIPKEDYMKRNSDRLAGYKHHLTNNYLRHLQKSLMDICHRENLHQVDLLSPSEKKSKIGNTMPPGTDKKN